MALRAAPHHVLVSPTGDNNQAEEGRIIVVRNDNPAHRIFRGVILDVGPHCCEGYQRGNVAHYTLFQEIHEKHIVDERNVIAFEDDE